MSIKNFAKYMCVCVCVCIYIYIYLFIYLYQRFQIFGTTPNKMYLEGNNIAQFCITFSDYCRNCLAHFWKGCLSYIVVELWFRSLHLLHKHENTGHLWASRFDATDWTCHTANSVLQLGNGHCVNIQDRSYAWLVNLASAMGGLLIRLLCTNI
jgi:hypothetical protein